MWCLHLDLPCCALSSVTAQPSFSKKPQAGNVNCTKVVIYSAEDVGSQATCGRTNFAAFVNNSTIWRHSKKNCSLERIMPFGSVVDQGTYLRLGNVGGLHTFLEKELQDSGYSTFAKQSKRASRYLLGRPICFKGSNTQYLAVLKGSFISCTTFNILAPIYKRVNGEDCRESQFREFWLSRNERILEMLLSKNSSIICLQEFWLGNEELVTLYEQSLGSAGYEMFQLARTNNRGDGLFTAIKKDELLVLDHRELLFHDCGDRVAQILRLQSVVPKDKVDQRACSLQELILVNTHLLFPHNSNYSLARLRQVHKILRFLEEYKAEHRLFSVPIVLCGDWNGSKRGQVYKFLRSQGFVSSYDLVHHYTDSDIDAHHWVSHRNHRGNICGVDFIWLLNPTKHMPPLVKSWKEAVFGIIKSKLREAGLKERDAFCFFKAENKFHDNVNLQEFHQALRQLGLTDEEIEGLTNEEVEDLMLAADFDGNGVIDFDEFKAVLSFQSSEQTSEAVQQFPVSNQEDHSPLLMPKIHCSSVPVQDSWSGANDTDEFEKVTSSEALREGVDACDPLKMTISKPIGTESWFSGRLEAELDVMDAFLYPPEVEEGRWPEHYSLSDHAPLTAIFTPICTARQTAAS
ncbi:hypothetical protein O6H91_23G042600 [Diphasiastrum complanatum]|uniref:Uncharacterized protein n=3 Tax=Diphasiastrum complanatum TaxID=34168 RepID=A0ACC2AA17_DIPCM|nr:hypothetical protein O6H91_23G042600 [Diphasiastrum complanatum]KAJ7514404.1 hypothetical protein O6H91_23G042600 [Diphasiastrum complanatum]KAJ7514406.1 hypothetical protein O6H91_23G042600 [Diphasiastrum complanatum]